MACNFQRPIEKKCNFHNTFLLQYFNILIAASDIILKKLFQFSRMKRQYFPQNDTKSKKQHKLTIQKHKKNIGLHQKVLHLKISLRIFMVKVQLYCNMVLKPNYIKEKNYEKEFILRIVPQTESFIC